MPATASKMIVVNAKYLIMIKRTMNRVITFQYRKIVRVRSCPFVIDRDC